MLHQIYWRKNLIVRNPCTPTKSFIRRSIRKIFDYIHYIKYKDNNFLLNKNSFSSRIHLKNEFQWVPKMGHFHWNMLKHPQLDIFNLMSLMISHHSIKNDHPSTDATISKNIFLFKISLRVLKRTRTIWQKWWENFSFFERYSEK